MTDKYLYRNKRVPNELQRRVLELHRQGKEPLEIGSGALLVAEPCLSCQLAGVGS